MHDEIKVESSFADSCCIAFRFQFRIIAENSVGKSDPSEISDALTVTLQRNAISAPLLIGIGLLVIQSSVVAQGIGKADVVSKGARFDFKKSLLEEGTTVVLFVQDSSAMEQQFLMDLEKQFSRR